MAIIEAIKRLQGLEPDKAEQVALEMVADIKDYDLQINNLIINELIESHIFYRQELKRIEARKKLSIEILVKSGLERYLTDLRGVHQNKVLRHNRGENGNFKGGSYL